LKLQVKGKKPRRIGVIIGVSLIRVHELIVCGSRSDAKYETPSPRAYGWMVQFLPHCIHITIEEMKDWSWDCHFGFPRSCKECMSYNETTARSLI